MRAVLKDVIAGALGLAVALSGGAGGAAAAAPGGESRELVASGSFAPATGDGAAPRAVTYDEDLVPAGATIRVTQRLTATGGMVVTVAVRGVEPGHTFGTHVHTEPCGSDPDHAGSHYQNVTGDDEALANPVNEVWLDFTAGEDGSGGAAAGKNWVFREGDAGSVILHENATSTGHHGGTPGAAGDRVACLTVPFQGSAG